jgi:uncharacterized protein
MLIVDADGHYAEPFDIFTRFMEAGYQDRAPRLEETDAGERVVWDHYTQPATGNGIGLGDSLTPRGMDAGRATGRRWHEGWPGGFDSALRLKDMDTDGIDAVVLYPSLGLVAYSVPDPGLQVAIMEALNRFAAEYCSTDPARLYGVANLPMGDPEAAARVLRRCVEEDGFVAGMVRPNPYDNRLLSDPDRDVVWATAQELDVPICVHEGSLPGVARIGNDRTEDSIGRHVMGHPMEQMAAFVSMYFAGIFERFPRLRVGFMECGSGWLPFLVHRMDEEMELFGWRRPDLTRLPSQVVRENGFVIGAEGDDPFVRSNFEHLGVGSVVWASDYPHRDARFPGTTEELIGRQDLDDEGRRALAGANAARFYRLQALDSKQGRS